MRDFAARLARLPETNATAWEEIGKIVESQHGGWQPAGRIVNISYYIPGEDKWEFADINESKQRAIATILQRHPLGGNHFPEWLENGRVSLPIFYHPADPAFMAAYLEIHWHCEMNQVSHTLNYNECDHSWDWSIRSAARSEEFSGKEGPLHIACERVLEHLFDIGRKLMVEKYELNGKFEEKVGISSSARFTIGYQNGRVNITAGNGNHDGKRILDVKGIELLTGRDYVFSGPSVTDYRLSPIEADVDERHFDIHINAETVGRLMFDLGARTVEWEIQRGYVGIGIRYAAIFGK